MYRIDDPSASPTLPAPEAALTEGYWTEGNPGSGTPATLERASWFNMIQEELRAIVVAAGLTPSKTTYNQVLTAQKSMFGSVVGSVRNLVMSVAAASATATLTADEIIVETTLGGQTFRLASFNKTINLATTGAGGMDTGTAPTSGFVALYAIYNPATATAALLATNATSAVQPNVYGGANMPSGYTASALISVWPTNSSKLFSPAQQTDRLIGIASATIASSSGSVAGSPIGLSAAIPLNAKTWGGILSITLSTTGSGALNVYSNSTLLGGNAAASISNNAGTGGTGCGFTGLVISTAQQAFITVSAAATVSNFTIAASSYTI